MNDCATIVISKTSVPPLPKRYLDVNSSIIRKEVWEGETYGMLSFKKAADWYDGR